MLSSILMLLTGVGVLLFGIKTLGQGMQKITSGKIKKNIAKFTKGRVQATACGAVVTFAMQSSTSSTTMTVGFTSAGILTLFQSLSLIVGCNIGSSFTGFLLTLNTLNLKEVFAAFTLVGVVMTFFKKQKVKDIGITILGFGLLFAGLVFVSNGVDGITSLVDINGIIASVNVPILLVLIGALCTILLQSSFALIAIVVTLISTSGIGLSLVKASFLIYGANIGTCLTTLLVALTADANGRRTAIFHLLFNVVGVVVFMLLSLTSWLTFLEMMFVDPVVQVVVLDIIFNGVTALIMLPGLKPIQKLLEKTVKSKKESLEQAWKLDESLLKLPTFAIKAINKLLCKLHDEVNQNYYKLLEYLKTSDTKLYEEIVASYESHVKITVILKNEAIRITGHLDEQDQQQIQVINNLLRILERISNRERRMAESLFYEGKIMSLNQEQKLKIEEFNVVLEKMLEGSKRAINYKAEEQKMVIEDIAETVLNLSENVSELKIEAKQSILNKAKGNTAVRRYAVFMGLLNDFDRLSSYISDLVVSMIETNENKENEYEEISEGY